MNQPVREKTSRTVVQNDFAQDTDGESKHRQLADLLSILVELNYRFTTVTPLTHRRFLSKNPEPAKNLQDIFGWSMPFELSTLPPSLQRLMIDAELAQPLKTQHQQNSLWKSLVRVSSLDEDVLLHSAFPTAAADAVFFGPDTYRFARFIHQTLHHTQTLRHAEEPHSRSSVMRVLDIGCGSGAGALAVARSLPDRELNLTLNDINPTALKYAEANMAAASVNANFLLGDVFTTEHGLFDLIISNPPYMKDGAGRAYRDGGDQLGLDFSLRLVQHGIGHLAPGGQFILYSGVAMTTHADPLLDELNGLFAGTGLRWTYEEIDPDVFGEELEQPDYAAAHRIAAVGLVVTRSR